MDIVDTPAINILVQSCSLLALCIYPLVNETLLQKPSSIFEFQFVACDMFKIWSRAGVVVMEMEKCMQL